MNYSEFLTKKASVDVPTGFEPKDLPLIRPLFNFQRDIVRWAIRRGRAALWEDCGLGKTAQQLAWANEVAHHTGRPVLILAPLAVAEQTVREGAEMGIEVRHVSDDSDVHDGPFIYITNYEKLHRFKPRRFAGVVLDESSILKSYDGHYRTTLIEAFADTAYRLACTATPAPNDFMELGNHAEFLGVMTREEMLSMFFTHDGGNTSQWRLKGHAQRDFWRWICSWAVNIRKPSDLGYPDEGFSLPPILMSEHIVESDQKMDGLLFAMPASSLQERREARRSSLTKRVETTYQLVCSISGNYQTAGSILNTCGNITEETKDDGRKAEKLETRLMNGGALNTPEMPITAPKSEDRSRNGKPGTLKKDTLNGCAVTESQGRISTQCFNGKEDRVQSVDSHPLKTNFNSRSSIIATQPDGCGEYSAHRAISESENSETAQSCLSPLPSISDPWIIWCNLNSEQSALEDAFKGQCISIHGSLDDNEKERRLHSWLIGERPILIGKASMLGFGLNLQRCHRLAFVGLSDSYEQFYQAVRRCWRFGQTKPVNAHLVISNLEGAVLSNLKRKERDAAKMAEEMVAHMADISSETIRGVKRDSAIYKPKHQIQLPEWLQQHEMSNARAR